MKKQYNNIFLANSSSQHPFTSKSQGGPKTSAFPIGDRKSHAQRLISSLEKAWKDSDVKKQNRKAISLPVKDGTYLEFFSHPDYELLTKSLEKQRLGKGIRLMKVDHIETPKGSVRKATVYIPKGKENYYLKKIVEYEDESKNTKNKRPRNEPLVANIQSIRLAVLESFWPHELIHEIPEQDPVWCEIWLYDHSPTIEEEFRELTRSLDITVQSEVISFPERKVMIAFANKEKLEELIESSDAIAEIRRAAEVVSFFTELENKEQIEWAAEALERIEITENSSVAICILDTGINNGHILLEKLLSDDHKHTYDPIWGLADVIGHGTQMAGIIGYGDLQEFLENKNIINILHHLESVKILPNPSQGENDPKLYGAITLQAISRAAIANPDATRIICMAVTAPIHTKGDGSPTSWSAAIDESCAGVLDGVKKLFIVSAGNVDDSSDWKNYPHSNLTKPVQNPAQSWNALAVGAYTEKNLMDTEDTDNYNVVAPIGGLSPYSTTSLTWDEKWPIKPDIVLEGGNVLKHIHGCFQSEDLSVLTTFKQPLVRQFDTIWATSAATAKASWMAAQIQTVYPEAWPETVKGLMIHSAEWTSVMKEQFLSGNSKTDIKNLLRVCGYGVPNLEKALWCLNNSVNLIIQDELQPYDKKGRTVDGKKRSGFATKDMHIHELPWPSELLLSMGATPVFMKVTLTYFIEPSPGEIGWKNRYRYPSCGLRFETNGSSSKNSFLRKISAAVEADEDETQPASNIRWKIGPNTRNLGSTHSDVWQGTAAELATSNLIGVYPTIGWWRERSWLKKWDQKIRYSLIVSLVTPETEIDLYTPIATQISINNEIQTEIF